MIVRTIHLDGALAKACGTKKVKLAGDTLQIITRGLVSRFGAKIKSLIGQSKFQIYLDEVSKKGNLNYDKVEGKLGNAKDVYILSAIEGSGRTGTIILGIVLIVAGVLTITENPGSTAMIFQGAGMILGGTMTIYAALNTPKAMQQRANPAENASFVFSGATNVVEQGGAVPLVYGRCLTGSTVVSAGLDVEQLQSYTSPLGGNPAPNSKFGII